MDAHDRGRASFVGAHRSWACIMRGRVWVVGMHLAWARMGRGRVWVVGGVVVGCGRSSFVVAGRCHPWVGRCRLRDGRPWVVGRGVVVVPGRCRLGVVCGRWVSFVGAGCCSCALGTLWVLGIVRGRWVVVGGVLWALGLLRVRSLLGVGSLLGVRSLLRALVVLGFSWDEHGGVGIITYRDVTMNDDFRLSFVVQLPRRCQRRGSCERGRSGGGLPPLVVTGCVRWWVVVALRSRC